MGNQNKGYSLGLYEKAMPSYLKWEDKFEAARKAGFDYVEMSIDETVERLSRLDWNKEEIHQLMEISSFTGMKIGSICLSGHRKYPLGGQDANRSLDIMKKSIDFASEAGIPIIQLAGYDVFYTASTPTTEMIFLKNLCKSVEFAAKAGVMLGFETMETPFMDTVGKAMHYVDEIASPYLGVYPDIGNLNNAALLYGSDILEDIELGKGHVFAIHIKETVPGKYREVPFGTGAVDFPKVLAKTWNLGVRRYVTELWHVNNADWFDRIAEASNLARGFLNSFGG